MHIIRDNNKANLIKNTCAFFLLKPTKYYCPTYHQKSSFPGEIKVRDPQDFVFSYEFKKAIDDLFRD